MREISKMITKRLNDYVEESAMTEAMLLELNRHIKLHSNIFICGKTSSGKTTLLCSILQEQLRTYSKGEVVNIITKFPEEMPFEGNKCVKVNAILDKDPYCIMKKEIRNNNKKFCIDDFNYYSMSKALLSIDFLSDGGNIISAHANNLDEGINRMYDSLKIINKYSSKKHINEIFSIIIYIDRNKISFYTH